jgi:hypothetical protein
MLRSLYQLANKTFQITLHWIKGHSVVGGNLRVDLLSKFFASCEHKVGSDGPELILSNYAVFKNPWPFGFPLCSVPMHLFKPAAELACIANWIYCNAFITYAELFPSNASLLTVLRKRKSDYEAPDDSLERSRDVTSGIVSVAPSLLGSPKRMKLSKPKTTHVKPTLPARSSKRLALSCALPRAPPCGFYQTELESLDFKHPD